MVGDELNQTFPDFKTKSCEEFIEEWWSGVTLGEPKWTKNIAFGADDM